MSAPRMLGVGAIFIDDIVQPSGLTDMGQLGGGVTHALMGAALWGEKPGLVALAGRDLSPAIRQHLAAYLDTRGLHLLDLPQIRAWQIFEEDGTRRELYRVEVTKPFIRGARPEHLPAAYDRTAAAYLLQDFAGIREWRAVLAGIVVWEPLQQIMVTGCRPALQATLRDVQIEVISPNLAEAQAAYGITKPEVLVTALLEDGALAVALRLGPDGSLIASREDNRIRHIPAVPVKQIVDQTGAGNTYCGALLAGLVQGRSLEDAARMGTVAASFCLEQRGVLDPGSVTKAARDERYRRLSE